MGVCQLFGVCQQPATNFDLNNKLVGMHCPKHFVNCLRIKVVKIWGELTVQTRLSALLHRHDMYQGIYRVILSPSTLEDNLIDALMRAQQRSPGTGRRSNKHWEASSLTVPQYTSHMNKDNKVKSKNNSKLTSVINFLIDISNKYIIYASTNLL